MKKEIMKFKTVSEKLVFGAVCKETEEDFVDKAIEEKLRTGSAGEFYEKISKIESLWWRVRVLKMDEEFKVSGEAAEIWRRYQEREKPEIIVRYKDCDFDYTQQDFIGVYTAEEVDYMMLDAEGIYIMYDLIVNRCEDLDSYRDPDDRSVVWGVCKQNIILLLTVEDIIKLYRDWMAFLGMDL